jgi:hypothetical protein
VHHRGPSSEEVTFDPTGANPNTGIHQLQNHNAVKLAASHHLTVVLTLNASGKRLLAKFHKLTPKLLLVQGGTTLSTRRVTVKAPPGHKTARHRTGRGR